MKINSCIICLRICTKSIAISRTKMTTILLKMSLKISKSRIVWTSIVMNLL